MWNGVDERAEQAVDGRQRREPEMLLQRFHHVAYRCRDAQETVDFYTKVLGLKYDMAHSNVSRHGDGN